MHGGRERTNYMAIKAQSVLCLFLELDLWSVDRRKNHDAEVVSVA